VAVYLVSGQGSVEGYSDWLRAWRSGDRIPVGARFSAPVSMGPGAHPASCTMGTGSFPGVQNGRGVTLTPHPLPVPWSWKGKAIPLLPLWAVRPVQCLSACTRVHFTFFTIPRQVSKPAHYIESCMYRYDFVCVRKSKHLNTHAGTTYFLVMTDYTLLLV